MLQNIANILCRIPINKNIMVQSIRTTFILKRRYEPLLHKVNQKPRRMRAKHFIYDLVEDTLVRKKTNVEVVLTTFVDGIGKKGEVVSANPTVAYNKLILPGLATFKTEENIKKYAQSQSDGIEELHSSPHAQRTVNMLQGLDLAVVMNKNESWKIEPWHIRASLRKAGYHCAEECITMPEQPIEGPDLNKEGKIFYVIITINNLEKANLKCRIHHWSTDPSERLPYVHEFWKLDSEPLFGKMENNKKS